MKYHFMLLVFSVIFISISKNVKCAKILGVFHFPMKSHQILGSALLKGLAKRGHQVTMVSPYPLDEPVENYTDLVLTEMHQIKEDSMMQTAMSPTLSSYQRVRTMSSMIYKTTMVLWETKTIKQLIESDQRYDVVILTPLFNDAILGLAHHLGASTVLFWPMTLNGLVNNYFGNPTPRYVTTSFKVFEISFFDRAYNIFMSYLFSFLSLVVVDPLQQELLDKYLPGAPSLAELRNNVSLGLINSHYTLESPRPYVPNMVQIGGFHIGKPKELSANIRKVLDEATGGVVLFCMGSNLRISDLPIDKLSAILNAFGQISPMRVLFRSEIDLPNVPENIRVLKWIPQNDVLAHPNIKAFVSHGGMGSIIEAIYHGVPLIGIPFFSDQQRNVHETAKAGITVPLKYEDLTEETFSRALNEVLGNPKYTENVKKKSMLFKDQPMDPLDKAIYWVEHVIRYKGASHLKNDGTKLKWYECDGFDVYLVFLTILGILVISSYKFLKFAFTKIFFRTRIPKIKSS